MAKQKLSAADGLYILSALLMLMGIILNNETTLSVAKFVFCAGGVGYIVYRIKMAYRGEDFRLKRLNRLYAYCGALVILSAYLMYVGNNAFLVLMLMVALLEFYVSYRAEKYKKDDA